MKLNEFLSTDFRLVGLNQFVIAIGSFCLFRLIAEVLPSDDFGKFNLLLSIGAIFSGVIYGGLEQAITRYCSIYKNNDRYIQTIYALLIAVSIVLFVIYASTVVVTNFKGAPYLFILGGFFSILLSINSILNTISNYNLDRKASLYNNTLLLIIRVVSVVVIWQYLDISLMSLIYIYIISIMIIIYKQVNLDLLKNIKNCSKKIAFDLISFSMPFIFSGVFVSFQSIADRWIIELLMETSDVGKYMAYYQMTFVPSSLLITVLINYVAPIYYHQTSMNEVNKSNLKKISLVIVFSGFLISGLLYFTLDIITELLIPSKYLGADLLIPVMTLSGTVNAAAQLLTIDMIAEFKTTKIMSYKSIMSVIYLLYTYPLINSFGLYGAALSLMLYSLFYYIFIFSSVK